MFVPLCLVEIALQTSVIETVPVYEVPLIKRAFKRKYGTGIQITVTALQDVDPTRDPYFQVLSGEQEEARLAGYLKHKKFFYSVYPGDTFQEAFARVAIEENPWPEKREELVRRFNERQAAKGARAPMSSIERMNTGEPIEAMDAPTAPRARTRKAQMDAEEARMDAEDAVAEPAAPAKRGPKPKAKTKTKVSTKVDANDL